ncbi:hypothetical protein ABL78_2473 [Leptomonas seymouri]|uniref:Uncharacterized protein n=1 Tax=Leptomonas seymouri TaxID=5684 RepID=A0A0N1PDE5_LEPSE|nr:hypothetical protein ABL78_2473 [Leptomonas seymouri]|eukprot:KPI88408.1 hypothetical protein ABL78_2473 [Leptomonas seymouri]
MFPQGLIDQWLSKPREGRLSVQRDPKATPAILKNIHQLEVYCREHPYEVFCASSLRSPPFSLYALESEEDERARLSRPPGAFAATPLPPTDAPPGTHPNGDTYGGGLGGRNTDKAQVHSMAMAAADHLRDVTARLATYLQSSSIIHCTDTAPSKERSTRSLCERASQVAQLVVHIIAEAAVAAAVRQGVAARVEALEQAAFQRRQSQRRLQLRVHGEDGAAAAAAPETATAPRGAVDDRGSNEKGLGEDYYMAVRPIADYRRDCQGLLSMAVLLPKLCATIGGEGDDKDACVFTLRKRTRGGTGVTHTVAAAELNGRTNHWTQLREHGLQQLFGTSIPPAPPVAVAAELQRVSDVEARRTSALLTPADIWVGMQLQITERDVLFALRKVFASGPT